MLTKDYSTTILRVNGIDCLLHIIVHPLVAISEFDCCLKFDVLDVEPNIAGILQHIAIMDQRFPWCISLALVNLGITALITTIMRGHSHSI